MENDFLKEFIHQATKENEAKIADEKRKKHFRELGWKGGLKKKTSQQYSKVVSVRLTEKEFEEIETLSSKYNLKISKYLRLILTEKELIHLLEGDFRLEAGEGRDLAHPRPLATQAATGKRPRGESRGQEGCTNAQQAGRQAAPGRQARDSLPAVPGLP